MRQTNFKQAEVNRIYDNISSRLQFTNYLQYSRHYLYANQEDTTIHTPLDLFDSILHCLAIERINIYPYSGHTTCTIESRGTVIVFEPTWAEAYAYIGEWFWDQEICDYLWEKMPLLREPDIRLVRKAYDTKLANIPGLPWRSVIDRHAADPVHIFVAEYLNTDVAKFGGEEQRIAAWVGAVKAHDPKAAASRATWHRYKNEVEDVMLSAVRPNRIVLERDSPPDEARPSDSPLESGSESEPESA